MPPTQPSEKDVRDLIANIITLSECLPQSVPLGTYSCVGNSHVPAHAGVPSGERRQPRARTKTVTCH